jgi:hypothetical protein
VRRLGIGILLFDVGVGPLVSQLLGRLVGSRLRLVGRVRVASCARRVALPNSVVAVLQRSLRVWVLGVELRTLVI